MDRPDCERGPCALAHQHGSFGLEKENDALVGLEWRVPRLKWDLRPIVGWSHISGGGNYWFAGLRYDWEFTDRWTLGPSAAAGVYQAGDIDLGGPVEFRTGIDLTYRITGDLRAGVGFYHVSNASLYEDNGGANALLFSLGAGL